MDFILIIKLFLTFLKIGAFSFGGGYAMIPLIKEEVVSNNGWLGENEFANIISISQVTPGPVAINTSTYVGIKTAGVVGAAFATFGVVLTSFIIVILVSKGIEKYKRSPYIKTVFITLRPIVLALILSAGISMIRYISINVVTIFLSIFVIIAYTKTKIPSPVIILLSGVVGIVFFR